MSTAAVLQPRSQTGESKAYNRAKATLSSGTTTLKQLKMILSRRSSDVNAVRGGPAWEAKKEESRQRRREIRREKMANRSRTQMKTFVPADERVKYVTTQPSPQTTVHLPPPPQPATVSIPAKPALPRRNLLEDLLAGMQAPST